MATVRSRARSGAAWRDTYCFWTLVALLAAAFLLGGSSREDTPTLILLRPLAAGCLAVGLYGLTMAEVRRYRGILIGAALLLLLVVVHLIPLPPSVWTALPGRQVAADVAAVAGFEQPWRPIAMVPWRAWNTLYSLLVPAAALVLAIRCTPEQHRRLPIVLLVLLGLSSLFAVAQVLAGRDASLNIHPVRMMGSVTGFFANRNHFALALCWGFLLLAFFAAQAERSSQLAVRSWLAGLAGAYGLLLLLLSGSRAGLMLAAVTVVALPLVYPLSGKTRRGPFRQRLGLLLLGLVAILLMAATTIYFSRAETINRIMAVNVTEDNRFDVWGGIVWAVGHYFPVGSGIGSFVDVYKIYEPRELLRPTYLNHAHNDWLEWPMETGLPGVLLLGAAVVAWGQRSFGLLRADARNDDVRLARVGALLILLLGLASIVDYPGRVPVIACGAILAAIWMANARTEGKTQAERDDGEPEKAPVERVRQSEKNR